MDLYTRSLIGISMLAAVSAAFTLVPGGAPITVTLISPDAPGGDGGALPSTAYARLQKMNSLGTFTDIAFLGSGRALSHEVSRVGTYRVVRGESTGEFGVDLTCADFALAAPGDPGPGPGEEQPNAAAAVGLNVAAPATSASTARQTYITDGMAVDITSGINVKRIPSEGVLAPEGSPAFPPLLPTSGSVTFLLMRDGVAFSIDVALLIEFPPPVPNAEI